MESVQGPMRCTSCGCLWRLNPPVDEATSAATGVPVMGATWSLWDSEQRPGECCDNTEMTLEPVRGWEEE